MREKRLILDRFQSYSFSNNFNKKDLVVPLEKRRLLIRKLPPSMISKVSGVNNKYLGRALSLPYYNGDILLGVLSLMIEKGLTFNFNSNFNRLLNDKMGIAIRDIDIIYGNNFIPVSEFDKYDIKDQMQIYLDLRENLIPNYYTKNLIPEYFPEYKEFFHYDDITTRMRVCEVGLELYPSAISELYEWFSRGHGHCDMSYSKTQSGTITFRPKRKIDGFKVKAYQKSATGLVRLEVTFSHRDRLYAFNEEEKDHKKMSEMIYEEFDTCLLDVGLDIDYLYNVELNKNPDANAFLIFVANMMKLDPMAIKELCRMRFWESTRKNRSMTRKLINLGLISKLSMASTKLNRLGKKDGVKGVYIMVPEAIQVFSVLAPLFEYEDYKIENFQSLSISGAKDEYMMNLRTREKEILEEEAIEFV